MERERTWPKSANQALFPNKKKGAPGFGYRFHMARSAFIAHRVYTPTWASDLSMEAKRDSLMHGRYTGVKVVPIMCKVGSPCEVYSRDMFATNDLTSDDHLRRAKLQLWPRNGEPCVCVPHPIIEGVKYPHGSFINLDECPLWAVHPLGLRQYLQVRGINLRQKECPRTLRKLVQRAMRQKRKPFTLEVSLTLTLNPNPNPNPSIHIST